MTKKEAIEVFKPRYAEENTPSRAATSNVSVRTISADTLREMKDLIKENRKIVQKYLNRK